MPLTDASTGTLFQFDWPGLIDLTGATVTFRVKAQAATGGGVQTYVQNGGAQNWAGVPWAWTDLSSLGDWTELTIDVDAAAADSTTFDKTQVRRIGIKVDAGTAGPWANPTVVYVDSIIVTRSSSAGGTGGAGGEVNITNTGTVNTVGDWADGIVAQSIGGGGGVGGTAVADGSQQTVSANVGVGGQGGGGGSGGAVNIDGIGTISTQGYAAYGLLAQSIGGGGGQGGDGSNKATGRITVGSGAGGGGG
ncbi:MAG TPA: hypothetical protein VL242_09050, partial [Sorangium sp.]|nr:hypothetical protein [Sorangium sp.]